MKNLLSFCIIFLMRVALSNAQIPNDTMSGGFLNEKVTLSGVNPGIIEKTEVFTSKQISFISSSEYKITSFKLTLVIVDSDLQILTNQNNGELTSNMIDAIIGAPVGSKLFFEFIRCVDKKGVYYSVFPVEYVLK